MIRKLILTLALAGAAGLAAASPSCEAVPKAEWQPREALQKKLEAEGWKEVLRIKVDEGCYEAYGRDAKGDKAERYYHPKTLEQVRK